MGDKLLTSVAIFLMLFVLLVGPTAALVLPFLSEARSKLLRLRESGHAVCLTGAWFYAFEITYGSHSPWSASLILGALVLGFFVSAARSAIRLRGSWVALAFIVGEIISAGVFTLIAALGGPFEAI